MGDEATIRQLASRAALQRCRTYQSAGRRRLTSRRRVEEQLLTKLSFMWRHRRATLIVLSGIAVAGSGVRIACIGCAYLRNVRQNTRAISVRHNLQCYRAAHGQGANKPRACARVISPLTSQR